MDIPSYYIVHYKSSDSSYWQTTRLNLPIEQWEDYCKQNFEKYEIVDLRKNGEDFIMPCTYYNGMYYLNNEKIPYPETDFEFVDNLNIVVEWDGADERPDFRDIDYSEVYSGVEELFTVVDIDFKFLDKGTGDIAINAIEFKNDFPKFLETLKQNKFATYYNDDCYLMKWICWIKDKKVRFLHLDYDTYENLKAPKTVFDIVLDEDYFFEIIENMTQKISSYAQIYIDGYNKYVEKHHGKQNT